MVGVPDLLIRNVLAEDLHRLDEQDLSALADLVPDLGDADITADAWS